MLGKFHKNTKSFNIIFSSLTFALIGLLVITSFYILVTTMLFKGNYITNTNMVVPNLYFDYMTKTASITGIILFVLVGFSFLSIIAYSICFYLFSPLCLNKLSTIWTICFLSFSIFVMFILVILGHAWTTNDKNMPHVIVQSFLLLGKDKTIQYGGASITVLIFDIVIYCCLIITLVKMVKSFIELSKNDYLFNQEKIN